MEGDIVQYISKVLSTLTIISCLFLKVPQIMLVRAKKSADGMSIQAMLMEITGFTIMSLYNFTNGYCLLTYMEYVIILFESYVLFYYVLLYRRLLGDLLVYAVGVVYFVIACGFTIGLLPSDILSYLVPFCTPMSGFSKINYIYGIVNEGNADSIALTTWVISVSTNLARVFTVYMDSGDVNLIMNFIISAMLSFGVLASAAYYQNFPVTPLPQRRLARRVRNSHYD